MIPKTDSNNNDIKDESARKIFSNYQNIKQHIQDCMYMVHFLIKRYNIYIDYSEQNRTEQNKEKYNRTDEQKRT
ncbi:hypothetical protein ACF0H5_015238 [Mactra antiquata]